MILVLMVVGVVGGQKIIMKEKIKKNRSRRKRRFYCGTEEVPVL